jgi:hypothetical protein
MRVPIGYIIVPEEERGTCRGCAFLIIDAECIHPDREKTFNNIGCNKERKIFKRDGRDFRAKLTALINKLGFNNTNGMPDYVLANHIIKLLTVEYGLCIVNHTQQ